MQNLSISSTPIDTRSSTAWHHGLTSKRPYWYQWKDRAWMSDTCIVQFSCLPSPGVNTAAGSQSLTEKILNLLVWIDCVDMKIS